MFRYTNIIFLLSLSGSDRLEETSMKKIANATELQTELQSLLRYAQTSNPSREKLAMELLSLSTRVAGAMDGVDIESLKAGWKAGMESGETAEEAKQELETQFSELAENIKSLKKGRSPIGPLGMPIGVFKGIGGNLWEIAFWMGASKTE
jgi:chromosome segregation ATPase